MLALRVCRLLAAWAGDNGSGRPVFFHSPALFFKSDGRNVVFAQGALVESLQDAAARGQMCAAEVSKGYSGGGGDHMSQRPLNARSGDSTGESVGLSARIRKAYRIGDLAQVFGVHHHRVERWAKRGLLGRARGVGADRRDIRFTGANVVRFIREHRCEYDLGRVDRTWFQAMVFGDLRVSRTRPLRRKNGF